MSCKLLCRDLNGSSFPIAHWWRLFLKPFPFVPPLKTSAGLATRGCYNNVSPVNIPINQRWNPVPSGIIKSPHLFSPYSLINWNNVLVRLWGQSDRTNPTHTLSPEDAQHQWDSNTRNWADSEHSQTSPFFLTKQRKFLSTRIWSRAERAIGGIRPIILSRFGSECYIFPPLCSAPSIFSHLSSNYIALGDASQLNKWYFDTRNYTRPHKAPFHVKRAFYYTVIICDKITHSVALEWVRVHLIK